MTIFLSFPRLLHIFKWGLLFDEKVGLAASNYRLLLSPKDEVLAFTGHEAGLSLEPDTAGRKQIGPCWEMNFGSPNPHAVTELTRLPQLVFCMPFKDRMKGVDVEGNSLDNV